MKLSGSLAGALMVCGFALPLGAATSAYLEWSDKPQTGAPSEVYGAWTELLAFKAGGSNPVTLSSGTGAGKFKADEVVLTTRPNPLLPHLATALTKGQAATALRIQLARDAQSGLRAFTEIDYERVFFTRVGVSGSAGDDAPEIEVRFVFGKMTWRVISLAPPGAPETAAGIVVDIEKNRVLADPQQGQIATGATFGSGPPPADNDADDDGLPDDWERAHGLNPAADDAHANPDGDPFDNFDEYLAGTDPRSANSYLKIEGLADPLAAPRLTWSSVAGKTYEVLYSAQGLEPATFEVIRTVTAGDTTTSVDLPVPTGQRGFYRVRVKTP